MPSTVQILDGPDVNQNATSQPVWQSLLGRALELIDHAEKVIDQPIQWSFGGGTVLMLRMNHRHSKDIDIFLADPQALGFFNPRLSDVAQGVTTSYEESGGHIKLYLPDGEIDFVVADSLTLEPFESATLLNRSVVLESSSEIIAKKMWHRGHLATARDLFDLAAVYSSDPGAIVNAEPFLVKNADAFLHLVGVRQAIMRAEFEAIDRQDCLLTFDECVNIAQFVLLPLVSGPPSDRKA